MNLSLFAGPADTANNFLRDERGFIDRVNTMNFGQQVQVFQQVMPILPVSMKSYQTIENKLFPQ